MAGDVRTDYCIAAGVMFYHAGDMYAYLYVGTGRELVQWLHGLVIAVDAICLCACGSNSFYYRISESGWCLSELSPAAFRPYPPTLQKPLMTTN